MCMIEISLIPLLVGMATNAYVQHGKALSHRWKGEQERRKQVKVARQAEVNRPSWWVGLDRAAFVQEAERRQAEGLFPPTQTRHVSDPPEPRGV